MEWIKSIEWIKNMEWIQSILTVSSDQSSYSSIAEWIQLITLQSLTLTAFLAGAKRYLNSVCNTPDQEDALPFIKYPLAVLEYMDSVEAYCISLIKGFSVYCFRKLRSRLFCTLSDFSQSLGSPVKVPRTEESPAVEESPRSSDKKKIVDMMRKLMGEEGTREINLRSGTVSSSWKITRSTVKKVAKKSDSDTNRDSLAESSGVSAKYSQSHDWYGYWVRQRQQARVPEVVERFGRPRTLLQGSNVPSTMRLLKSTKYTKLAKSAKK